MNTIPFVKMERGTVTERLLKTPFAFTLLALISLRARRSDERSYEGLTIGEAMIGDYESIGATRQQYRTAINLLRRAQFVTSRSTNKGTVVKLTKSAPFDINADGYQPPVQPLPNQQTTSEQPLKKNVRKKKEELVESVCVADAPTPPTPKPAKGKKPATAFVPPTEAEVEAYAMQQVPVATNAAQVARKFVGHYTAVGWAVGKKKMVDWQGAFRVNWQDDLRAVTTPQPSTGNGYHQAKPASPTVIVPEPNPQPQEGEVYVDALAYWEDKRRRERGEEITPPDDFDQ